MGLKCTACKQHLPETAFSKGPPPRRFQYSCKECAADFKYRNRYGISRAEADALKAQGCQACGGTATHIDHDHSTGLIRGALCADCNLALGHVRDSVDRLLGLVTYIIRHDMARKVK